MECWAKDFLFFFSFLHVSSRWYPVGPSFHIVFLWSFTMIWFSFDLNLQRFSLHSRMFCKRIFGYFFSFLLLFYFFFWDLFPLRRWEGRRSALQDIFFSFRLKGKERRRRKKVVVVVVVLPQPFFLLPLRWRPTCRSERVSDRTIKLKKGKKKQNLCECDSLL